MFLSSARSFCLSAGLLSAFLVALTTGLPTRVFAAPPPSPSPDAASALGASIEEWSGKVGDELARQAKYSLGNDFSNAIWDGLSDLQLESTNSTRFSQNLEVERHVFDNHDVNNSYTVVDNFFFRSSIPLYSKSLWSGAGSMVGNTLSASLGISFGTSQGIELMDIRQVASSEFRSFPKLDDIKKTITDSNWYTSLEDSPNGSASPLPSPSPGDSAPDGLPNPEQPIVDPGNTSAIFSLSFLDPLRHARYSDYWNIFTFPFREPFTADGLKKLDDGEVISYNLYGAIQVGASLSWSGSLNTFFNSLTGDAYYSAYIRGDYRISVLKENDRYARVKVTRTYTNGRSTGIDNGINSVDYIGGFVFLHHRYQDRNFSVAPFNIHLDTSNADAFDVGYRYDLDKPEAKQAYHLAVLGRFAYSEQLAGGMKGSSTERKDTGVEKIFTREQKISTEIFSSGVNIASFFRRGNTSSFSDWDAVVTLPDGTRKIVSTDTEDLSQWKLWWGPYERTTYAFRVSLDVTRLTEDHTDALYLVAEGTTEDSNASGKDLREYEEQTEAAAGVKDIFPRLPTTRPFTDEEVRKQEENDSLQNATPPPAEYGPSNFYYRLMFSQDQIEKFIHFPEDQMWTALEKAFDITPGDWSTPLQRTFYMARHLVQMIANYPLYIVNLQFYDAPKLYHAESILSNWLALRDEKDPRERVKKLGQLFADRMYGRELAMLLRTALPGEQIQYTVSGSNGAFGRIFKQGDSIVNSYPLPTRINNEIDYDQPQSKPDSDNTSQITKLMMNPTSDGEQLVFGANQRPQAIYLRIVEDGGWTANTLVGQWIIGNTGNSGAFDKGDNTVNITPGSPEPWATIAKKLVPGNQYYLSMSMSVDGQTWGPLTTVSVYIPNRDPSPR